MKFLLTLGMTIAWLDVITPLVIDLGGISSDGHSNRTREQENNIAKYAKVEASAFEDQEILQNISKNQDTANFQKSVEEIHSNEEVKRTKKIVFKRGIEDNNINNSTTMKNVQEEVVQPQVSYVVSANLVMPVAAKSAQGPAQSQDMNNIWAMVGGGGLVSVAKGLQILFVKKREKKQNKKENTKNKKKGKKEDTEDDEDEESGGISFKIELK